MIAKKDVGRSSVPRAELTVSDPFKNMRHEPLMGISPRRGHLEHNGSLVRRLARWRSTSALSTDGARIALVRIVRHSASTPWRRRMVDLLAQDLRRAVEPIEDGALVRTQYQMRRPLNGLVEASVKVRRFRVGRDETELGIVMGDAFAWLPSAVAEMDQMMNGEIALRPDWLLVHEADSGIDGFCWTKERSDDPTLGEIYALGVASTSSGQGIGRQLLRAGLSSLKQRGLSAVVLNVDASNTHAVALYVAEGFIVHRLEREFGTAPPLVARLEP